MNTSQYDVIDRLPWHRPEVKSLAINFDTGNSPGSGPDLATLGINLLDDIGN